MSPWPALKRWKKMDGLTEKETLRLILWGGNRKKDKAKDPGLFDTPIKVLTFNLSVFIYSVPVSMYQGKNNLPFSFLNAMIRMLTSVQRKWSVHSWHISTHLHQSNTMKSGGHGGKKKKKIYVFSTKSDKESCTSQPVHLLSTFPSKSKQWVMRLCHVSCVKLMDRSSYGDTSSMFKRYM